MTKPLRVGFCVSGGGRLFRAAANQAARLNIVPVLAVGETGCSGELEDFCAQRQITFTRLDAQDRTRFNSDLTRLCIDAQLDLLCLTFDRIIPPALVAHYRGRVINVHMGLLPAFKGTNALRQAVEFGARFAGATIHEVDEQVDHGAVIAQCVVGIRRGETAETIGGRLFGLLRLMFLQVLHWYSSGRVTRDEQGRVWIRDAVYGELPVSPALEDSFPD
jgi:phosphoribosylglycinamide formyltransferase 1